MFLRLQDVCNSDHDAIFLTDVRKWAVLRPHYGRPARAFWLNARARPNVKLDIVEQGGYGRLTVTSVCAVRCGQELFWSYRL